MMLARFRTPALGITIGAAVMAPVLGLAVPAQAAPTGHGGSGPASAHARTPSVINNAVFAGYQATVPAVVTFVATLMTLPAWKAVVV